jgi:hypothetical protein
MAVRPNIQSLTLDGADLLVRGETDDEHPATAIHAVVVQNTAAGAARAHAFGIADRAGSGWRATLDGKDFVKGPAEAMGVEIRIRPFQVTSWVQTVPIV